MVQTAWLMAEDEALKSYLSDLTVDDPQVTNREVKAWFALPRTEEREITYPYITIDPIGLDVDHEREHQGVVDWQKRGYVPFGLPDVDPLGEAGQTAVTVYPTPYMIVYAVVARSRNPRHDRQLTAAMMGVKFRRGAGLRVTRSAADDTVRRLDLVDHFPANTMDGDKRLFRHVYHVGVSTELLPATVEAVQKVLTVVPSYETRMEYSTPSATWLDLLG